MPLFFISSLFDRSVFFVMCVALFCFTAPSWAAGAVAHRLFADQEGRLWAWGAGEYGQLGLAGRVAARVPQAVDVAASVVSAATGKRHSVALDVTGAVWTWGDNSAGQLGTGNFRRVAQPSKLGLGGVAAIASGAWHVVALDGDGRVWVWGSGALGQLGNGRHDAFSVSAHPVKVAGLGKVVAIASGDHHVLALAADGSVWMWGAGQRGEPGGNRVVHDRPVAVAGLVSVRSISAGGEWSQAVGKDGSIWVWGRIPGQDGVWQTPQVRSDRVVGEEAPPVVVSGRVSADGQPVSDAEISVGGEFCGRTDERGVYRCLTPLGFKGVVKAKKNGFSFSSVKLAANSAKLSGVDVAGKAKAISLRPEVVQGLAKKPSAPAMLSGNAMESLREKSFPQPPRIPPSPVPEVVKLEAVKREAVKEERSPPPRKEDTVAAAIRIFGNIRLSGSRGRPVGGVQVSGEGAQCGKTGGDGEYVCTVPPGWSGRLSAAKRDYRFSPNSLFFQGVREDRPEQDFVADYGPD